MEQDKLLDTQSKMEKKNLQELFDPIQIIEYYKQSKNHKTQ